MSYFNENQRFSINSRNRIGGTNSNFVVMLDIDPNVTYDRVVLLDASIPKSYYSVQDGYNTFTVTEGVLTRTITMTPGNYTRTSFANELIWALNTDGLGWTYSVTYQNIGITVDTGHYFFSVTGNSSVQPSFTFTDSLYEQMGFNPNSTYHFIANQLESDNVINLNPEQTLFIKSDICQNRNTNTLDDIITSTSSSFSQINYVNYQPQETAKIFNGNGKNTFQFILVNEDDIEIDLQGQNMILSVMVFKSNDINKMLKDFLKFLTLKLDTSSS